jgi:hypothetical protein
LEKTSAFVFKGFSGVSGSSDIAVYIYRNTRLNVPEDINVQVNLAHILKTDVTLYNA